MDTLTTPWPPAQTSGGASETGRVRTSRFNGDAIRDLPDGINLSPLSYSATWDLHFAAADTLLDFLRAHAGQTFLWTMPRENSARAWMATSWTRTSPEPDRDQVQVTFEERFT